MVGHGVCVEKRLVKRQIIRHTIYVGCITRTKIVVVDARAVHDDSAFDVMKMVVDPHPVNRVTNCDCDVWGSKGKIVQIDGVCGLRGSRSCASCDA